MDTALNLYDQDFYAWTQEQAKLIKQKVFKRVDIAHLEEELESMGASEQRSLESKLTQLMMHMLKLKYQPDYINTKSWIRSIKFQRNDIHRILKKSPSLHAKINEFLSDVYENAILMAANETGLEEDECPSICEWSSQQVLDNTFYPI